MNSLAILLSYNLSILSLKHAEQCSDLIQSRGVTPQSSVLPPVTTVKHKVKGQEAKIIKVKGEA